MAGKGHDIYERKPPLADGIYGAKPTGPLLAYLTFAYDLYIVEHNGKLDPRLMERLKRADQFQGARHELFAKQHVCAVASTFNTRTRLTVRAVTWNSPQHTKSQDRKYQ